ncbi:MAG: A24 family peptidase, partial [Patescibacteria group bacterium]
TFLYCMAPFNSIDFKFFIIPNELNFFLMILGVAITFFLSQNTHGTFAPFRDAFVEQYAMLFSPFSSVIWNHIAGAVLGFLFFLMLNVFTRGRGIGFGDVKLSFALGLIFGWPDIALIAALSFIIGGLWSAGLVMFGAKRMRDKVPFAPFFVAGALLTFFFGFLILKGYFAAFGL